MKIFQKVKGISSDIIPSEDDWHEISKSEKIQIIIALIALIITIGSMFFPAKNDSVITNNNNNTYSNENDNSLNESNEETITYNVDNRQYNQFDNIDEELEIITEGLNISGLDSFVRERVRTGTHKIKVFYSGNIISKPFDKNITDYSGGNLIIRINDCQKSFKNIKASPLHLVPKGQVKELIMEDLVSGIERNRSVIFKKIEECLENY